MLILLPLLALTSPEASATRTQSEPARCRPGADQVRRRSAGPARPLPLGEMPPARPVLSVYREVNGCAVVLVREGGRVVEEPAGDPVPVRALRR